MTAQLTGRPEQGPTDSWWTQAQHAPSGVVTGPANPYVARPPGGGGTDPDRTRALGGLPRRLVVLLAAGSLAMGIAGGAGTVAVLEHEIGPQTSFAQVAGAPPATLDARAVAAKVLPSVVSIQTATDSGGATGSGFVLDKAGHILTNAHVVNGARQVQVVTNDGTRLPATIVGADEANDIAVLSVGADPGLPPATLGRSADTQVGDAVLAVGSPLGLSGTVTQGIISSTNREVRMGETGGTGRALQTDASINPGNSGGPLVDAAGRVVGVNSSIATLGGQGGGSIGIGFAIPIDHAADVAADLINH